MSTYEMMVCDRCQFEQRRPKEKPYVPEGWVDLRIEHTFTQYSSTRLILCLMCVSVETVKEALGRDCSA